MRRGATAVLVWLLLAGCSTGESVDASKALQDGAGAMATLKTVGAALKFTKGTVSFQGLTLVTATASVRLPADSDTIYKIKQQDVTIGLEVIITGGHVYMHAPFSSYREVYGPEAASIPDLAKLFDRSSGLQR